MNIRALVWIVVIVVVVGGGWLIYTHKGGSGSTETGPIKIGFIGPLTGDAASIGTAARAGAELAVGEINAAGGVNGRQIEVDYQDGQCSAQPATGAATKFFNDGVTAILGGLCSTETAAFAPAAMQHKVVTESYCSSAPSLSSTGKYFFRDYPSDAYQGKFGADYAYNTLSARNVAVISHISDYGTGIKNVFETEFRALGGTIVDDEALLQTATDYRTELAKIKSAKPDYIYAAMYPAGATAMAKQMKELGITTKILGGDAWGDTKLFADVQSLGLDIKYTTAKENSSDAFKAKILAKIGGQEVPECAAQAYDGTYILANALKSAGTSDPDAIANAMRATKYDGVAGHYEFDQNGDVTNANYVVMRIADGKSTLVQ